MTNWGQRTISGSSPQVRGTFDEAGQLGLGEGLIPAGAGNIARPSRATRGPRAHPRRCGEHGADNDVDEGLQGSSPQVRGTSGLCQPPGELLGLIPAGAGNIIERLLGVMLDWGSSSQVRGTYQQLRPRREQLGLIPAGAGNIRDHTQFVGGFGAHPRRCGEHLLCCPARRRGWGSSPQVRGTSPLSPVHSGAPGLIPAGAGNILHRHPAGETDIGSSPQVRGTLLLVEHVLGEHGLIPAGAGNIRN